MIKINICQRGMIDKNTAKFVFRNLTVVGDSSTVEFSIKSNGILLANGIRHGNEFPLPAGACLSITIEQTSGTNQGETVEVLAQPYTLVVPDYDIFHFYHEEKTEVTWGIGNPIDNPEIVCVLKSTDYFETCEPPLWSFNLKNNELHKKLYYYDSTVNKKENSYWSIYLDMYGNVIINWRPGPLISRDGGHTFEPVFNWLDPAYGMLCPFWNITEDDNGLMVISEYGGTNIAYDVQQKNPPPVREHGSHRGTFWSRDKERKHWITRLVDADFDKAVPQKFGDYFRHIHGYHINPEMPNVHHMFLGDSKNGHYIDNEGKADTSPGYYVSLDGGETWGDEIIANWASTKNAFYFYEGIRVFYNGPCFITWWNDGKAFITSDTALAGHAFWWGTGPVEWGGQWFDPAIELLRDIDSEKQPNDPTPWMAMTVKSSYETYCTTSGVPPSEEKHQPSSKEIVWRYDYDPDAPRESKITVLAEHYPGDSTFKIQKTLRWLSGSRHNRIPAQAKYFFTSGNRRFPRL